MRSVRMDANQTIKVDENCPDYTDLLPVKAFDRDAGQTLAYSITGGTGASYFTIDSGTGFLALATNPGFNASTTPSYTLTIHVVDNGSSTLSADEDVEVVIADQPTATIINESRVRL